MNDEFLHKLRIEPPRRFIAALKDRLDRQSDLHRTNSMWLRNSLIAAVICASGLAAAVMVVNSIRAPATNTNAMAHRPRPTAGGGDIAGPHAPSASTHSNSDPAQNAGSVVPQPAGPGDVSSSASGGPVLEGMRIMGPSSLSSALKEATRILNLSRPFGEPAFSMASTDAAIASLCNLSHAGDHPRDAVAGAADAVGATRRISTDELKRCESNGVRQVAEIKLGYEAIVLARSNLYPAPKLTAPDVFLALAAKIPDPERPKRLIPNPNISWNQVNPALADERIDISGPPLDADAVTVLRELLLEPGCSTFVSLAALKEKDRARYDDVCKGIRTDGTYHGKNSDLFGQLEAHPEALALVDFRYFAANGARLTGVSIEGVEPTSAEVYSGNYPGSRSLYLYVNVARTLVIPRMRDFIYALQDSFGNGVGSTTLVAGSEADHRESRQAAQLLPHVKL